MAEIRELRAVVDGGVELSFPQIAVAAVESDRGYRIFMRAFVEVKPSSDGLEKLGLIGTDKGEPPQIWKEGIDAGRKFLANIALVAHEFCDEFLTKSYDAGFRISWRYLERPVKLKDGSHTGPGLALFLKHCSQGEKWTFDANEEKAIAFGNAMNFERDGCKVVLKELGFGILAGGRIYQSVVEDPEGKLFTQRSEDEKMETVRAAWRSFVRSEQKRLNDDVAAHVKKLTDEVEALTKEFQERFTERKLRSVNGKFTVTLKVSGSGKLVLGWELKDNGAKLSVYRVHEATGGRKELVAETRENNFVPLQMMPGEQCRFELSLEEWKETGTFKKEGSWKTIDWLNFVQPMPTLEEEQAWQSKLVHVLDKLERWQEQEGEEFGDNILAKALSKALKEKRSLKPVYDEHLRDVQNEPGMTKERFKEEKRIATKVFDEFKWKHEL